MSAILTLSYSAWMLLVGNALWCLQASELPVLVWGFQVLSFFEEFGGGYLEKLLLYGSEVHSHFTAFGEVFLRIHGTSMNVKLKFRLHCVQLAILVDEGHICRSFSTVGSYMQENVNDFGIVSILFSCSVWCEHSNLEDGRVSYTMRETTPIRRPWRYV